MKYHPNLSLMKHVYLNFELHTSNFLANCVKDDAI